MLDEQFYKNDKYKDYLEKTFIPINAVRGEEIGNDLFKLYKVNVTPTILIADVDGSVIERVIGYDPPADDFLVTLKESYKKEDTFKNLISAYKKDPSDLNIIFKLAQKYQGMYKREEASEFYGKVLEKAADAKSMTVKTDEFGKEQDVNLYEYARYLSGVAALSNKRDVKPLISFLSDFPESKFDRKARIRISGYFRFVKDITEDEIIEFFDDSHKKYPDDTNLMTNFIGYAVTKKIHLERAKKVADKVLELDDNPSMYFMTSYVRLLKALGEEDKIGEVFGENYIDERVDKLSWDMVTYVNYWLREKENFESLKKTVRLMIELNPTQYYMKQVAARVFLADEDEDTALEIYGPAYIETKMDKPAELYRYAGFWDRQGKNLESAEKTAAAFVEMTGQVTGKRILASLYLRKGDEKKAMKLYGPEYLKGISKDGRSLYSYASFWNLKGKNLESALKAIQEAVKLSPDVSYYNRVLTQIKEKIEKSGSK